MFLEGGRADAPVFSNLRVTPAFFSSIGSKLASTFQLGLVLVAIACTGELLGCEEQGIYRVV